MKYIVELEKGVWLADWEGDPARTVVLSHAEVFKSANKANVALAKARMFRELPNAVIRPYSLVEDECVQAGKGKIKYSEKQTEATEKWLKNKLLEYEDNYQKTSVDLLVDTVEAIEQYLANRDSLASKSVLESCLKHNKMFLKQIGR